MRGRVSFKRSRILVFEIDGTKYNVRYTRFSFYPMDTLSRYYLGIYNEANLLLLGRFEEKICLKLTGHLTEFESFHKFIFTNKMFTYINYDDLFKASRVSREVRIR